MKQLAFFIVALVHISAVYPAPPLSTTPSFVVSSTELPKEHVTEKEDSKPSTDIAPTVPRIYEMNVRTNVSNRFATTQVTSKVRNLANSAQEATFSVIIPETAYISGFVMEIDGKSYVAYVKEKEEAKKIYDQAVQSGQSTAHVTSNARDSNRFTVSVNVEPQSKATFKLTYDELLQRQNEQYELVLNIRPGQPVKMLNVDVYINESRLLKFVRTPPLRTGNEISKNDDKLNPSADINIANQTALIKFSPDEEKQKKFAADLGTKEDGGLAGQFVVQYDVERDSSGGEILLKDGYFVHFFAPSELKSLPKYVVFVLDTSGSMGGIRIQQLKGAMKSILAELKAEDIFSLVDFGTDVAVWNVETTEVEYWSGGYNYGYGTLPPPLPHQKNNNNVVKGTSPPPLPHGMNNNNVNQTLPPAFEAHADNIFKANTVVGKLEAQGGTDIESALETGLRLIEKTKSERNNTHQPIVIFLTDGEPTLGETNTGKITSKITELNSGDNRSPIFSLSFGSGADRNFLKKISLRNLGFSRHIYEAADASLQLQEFYRQISSPLLSDVSFKYTEEAEKLTKTNFPIFFSGSEIVICGIIRPNPEREFIRPRITGRGVGGKVELAPKIEHSDGSLEKLWAYLTVKQVLEQRDAAENKTSYTKKALDIALKYSFVTPVSSLVVVKPNDTNKAVDTEDASSSRPHRGQHYGILTGASNFASRRPAFGPPAPTSIRPLLPHIPGTTIVPEVKKDSIQNATVIIDKYANIKLQLPWLKDILNDDGTLTSPAGNFKLGLNKTVTSHPKCPKTPGTNGTEGVCTLLPDCPQVFKFLTNVQEFTQHFCALNEFAGVCCPVVAP